MKKIIMAVFVTAFLSVSVFASDFAYVIRFQGQSIPFTHYQIDNLRYIWHTTKSLPNSRGETWHYTLSAIALQESSLGLHPIGDIRRNAPMTQGSYGLVHMQLRTARHMANYYKLTNVQEMTDVQLVNRLVRDREFSIIMAIGFLNYLDRHTNSYFQMVSRYNGGNSNRPYYNAIIRNIQIVRELEKIGVFE